MAFSAMDEGDKRDGRDTAAADVLLSVLSEDRRIDCVTGRWSADLRFPVFRRHVAVGLEEAERGRSFLRMRPRTHVAEDVSAAEARPLHELDPGDDPASEIKRRPERGLRY